jgi:putative FmdB family regulatory protein
MPIYEYEFTNSSKGCPKCRQRFEIIQSVEDKPLSKCPECGGKIKKVISWCRAAVIETRQDHQIVEKKIGEYEKRGMWSHAAELADKHSEKTKDRSTKIRALDNYKKAGYDTKTLDKYSNLNED